MVVSAGKDHSGLLQCNTRSYFCSLWPLISTYSSQAITEIWGHCGNKVGWGVKHKQTIRQQTEERRQS